MTKKLKDFTQREFLEAIIAKQFDAKADTGQTIQQKATELLQKIDARNAANKTKQKRVRVDNSTEKAQITAYLRNFDESVKAKEIAEATDLTVQKVAAVLKQLVAEGKVERLDLGRNRALEYRLSEEGRENQGEVEG